MIKQEIIDSATDEGFKRRLQMHGDSYHYDNFKREGVGETFRILGKILGDWSIDLHVANQRAQAEIWGTREESPDLIYIAPLGEDTPDLNRMVDIFKFKRVGEANVQIQKPGACVTNHHDDLTYQRRQSKEKVIRMLITLEDWHPGQSMFFGNSVLSYWEKGQIIYSDYEKIPHSTSNASWNSRSILRITGEVSEETIQMLAFNLGEVSI
jgi:hypothetical protein